ncbi:MAG: hypothetical protein QM764_06800 [Chitinophagaceae bacterium]
MKLIKQLLSIFILTVFSTKSFGQTSDLLDSLPGTKEEFIQSEKKVLATINWLENTPIDEDPAKHKLQYALLTAWITNSPTVTIEVNSRILTFTKKNNDLIMLFMAGWTKYSLENNYAKDNLQGNLAGIRSAMKVYKQNPKSMKKDKEMEKLITLEEKGELEKWAQEQLSAK